MILKVLKAIHLAIISLWDARHLEFSKRTSNRTYIVISRQKNYNPDGCIVVDSIEKIATCPKMKIYLSLAVAKFIH
jgi:chemotaxis signal transduction protein